MSEHFYILASIAPATFAAVIFYFSSRMALQKLREYFIRQAILQANEEFGLDLQPSRVFNTAVYPSYDRLSGSCCWLYYNVLTHSERFFCKIPVEETGMEALVLIKRYEGGSFRQIDCYRKELSTGYRPCASYSRQEILELLADPRESLLEQPETMDLIVRHCMDRSFSGPFTSAILSQRRRKETSMQKGI